MTIEELRHIKDEKGISLAYLAELSGVPIGTVVKVFNGGSKNPRQATLTALERALKNAPPKYNNSYDNLAVHGSTMFEGSNTLKIDDTRVGDYSTIYGHIKTIDDYYRISDGERYELVDGELIRMESPSFVHQSILLEFCTQVHNQIKSLKGKCKVAMAPLDVRILKDDRNMLQPDAIILCDMNKNVIKRIEGAPDMVLEVLSPTNGKEYLFKKRVIYVAAGVKEYWVIDPMIKSLIIYRIDENYRQKIIPLAGEQSLAISDGLIRVDLDDIRSIIEDYETDTTENTDRHISD